MAEQTLEAGAVKQNVKKKNVKYKKFGKLGEVAHYHKRENENEEWEQACYFVNHTIKDEAGFKINDELYKGTVLVPQCTANYLNQMEQAYEQSEAGLYKANNKSRHVASY